MINNCSSELCPDGNCLGCKDGQPDPNDPRCAPYCYPVAYKKDVVDSGFFFLIAFLLFLLFVIFAVAYFFLPTGKR
jgi:hypothetical protein